MPKNEPQSTAPPEMAKTSDVATPPFSIPNYYTNGFELGISLADMHALLLLDGFPQARLSLSFTTAKTLSIELAKMVATFEQATSHTVMDMNEVKIGLEKHDIFGDGRKK